MVRTFTVRRLALFAVAALVPVTVVTGVAVGSAAAAGNTPVVKHLTPHHGSRGTAVAVEGANLNGATAVDFGGTSALSFHVASGKAIIARVPSGTGTVDVTVTTPNGTSATSTKDQFTYDATTPLVKSLQPRQGPAHGGTLVTITGDRLNGATAVDFGATAASDVKVYSHHLLTAVSPAGTGTVDVTVTTPEGTSPLRRSDHYTYSGQGPSVTGVSPHRGAVAGGTAVLVHGKNLTGATAVNFGPNAATNVSVISSHLISATSPGGSGTVDVTVTTPEGTSNTSTADTYTYTNVAPVVKRVAPHHGPAAGGTSVVITGGNLGSANAVHFGSTSATFHIVSGKIVVATAPAGTGTVDVTVTTPNGTSATTSKDQFTYR